MVLKISPAGTGHWETYSFIYSDGQLEAELMSHVKVQITASRKDIYLVLVYGITEHPMMLATNKKISSKEDVIRVGPRASNFRPSGFTISLSSMCTTGSSGIHLRMVDR